MDLKTIAKEWYWNDNIAKRNFIAWEILKDIRRNSCDFIGQEKATTRFYHIGNFSYLLGQLKERFVETDNPYWHFFKSNCLIRVMNQNERADVKEEFKNLVYGWNLYIDLENPEKKKKEEAVINIDDVIKEAKILKKFFDENRIPYTLTFSGRAGIRFAILWNDLKSYFTVEDFGNISGKFGDFIVKKSKVNQKFVDEGVLHASGMALIRVLYSLHPKSMLICYPLNDEEFETFSLDKMEHNYILEHLNIIRQKESLDKKREGDLSIIYKEFLKTNKKRVDEIEEQREKEKIESIKRKQEILNKFNLLTEKEKKEVLQEL